MSTLNDALAVSESSSEFPDRTRFQGNIPELYCPIPLVIASGGEEITANSVEWMAGFGLCDSPERRARSIATRSGELVCRWAPNGAPELLQFASDWMALGFALDDDYFDIGSSRNRPGRLADIALRLTYTMNHPEAVLADGPYEAAFRNLSTRLRSCAPAIGVRRWVDGNMDWFIGAVGVAAHRAEGSIPRLDEYLMTGPRDRGGKVSFAMIEVAEGMFLPTEIMETRPVRAVFEMASVLVMIVSDIFSFNRERRDRTLESNIVAVLMQHNHLSQTEAFAEAATLHDYIMSLYQDLRQQLETSASVELSRFLGQLDHWVRGNLDWHMTVPRYHDEVNRVPMKPSALGVRSDMALARASYTISLPATAWWRTPFDGATIASLARPFLPVLKTA